MQTIGRKRLDLTQSSTATWLCKASTECHWSKVCIWKTPQRTMPTHTPQRKVWPLFRKPQERFFKWKHQMSTRSYILCLKNEINKIDLSKCKKDELKFHHARHGTKYYQNFPYVPGVHSWLLVECPALKCMCKLAQVRRKGLNTKAQKHQNRY